MAVGKVHSVGCADDNQKHEEAKKRNPDHPGSEHKVLVETGNDDVLR